MALNTSLNIKPRLSQDRGQADHGWLKSFHTFNFASYYEHGFDSFGALRVINEDRVAPTQGFPTHPHREFEIFSYIVNGELVHRDSLGNIETLRRGDLQMTSTGTGVRHSEMNDNKKDDVHFIQIWALPNQSRLPPSYSTRHFKDDEKIDKIATIVAPFKEDGVSQEREASGPAPVHSPLHLFATILSPGKTVTHTFHPALNPANKEKKLYVQVIQASQYNTKASLKTPDAPRIVINGDTVLGEGDGAFITGGQTGQTLELRNEGGGKGEVLLFEMD